MCLDFLERLSKAFAKRSKAIQYSGGKLTLTYNAVPEESLAIDYRKGDGVWIGLIFGADSFVEVAIEQRRINRRRRRLAKLGRLHIYSKPEVIVAACEETFSLAPLRNETDEWWRTSGQAAVESIWLKLGT